MGFYNQHIAPRIVSWACSIPQARRQRRKVVPRARGRVLEIGMGSGHNLEFYDPDRVEMVWGLEPGETMRKLAAPRVQRARFEVQFLDLPGEQIPLEDNSADTVLTTFTLCTIPDAAKALEGMRRVLKPDGELLFLEHGESPDEDVRRWQHRLDPLWGKLFGGCQLSRPIPRLIEAAGFKIMDLETGYLPKIPRPLKPSGFEYWGSARIA